MCRHWKGAGDGFERPFLEAGSVAQAFFGDLIDTLTVGEVR